MSALIGMIHSDQSCFHWEVIQAIYESIRNSSLVAIKSCITAHPVKTCLPLLALVAAPTAVQWIDRGVHAVPAAADIAVFALAAALSTVIWILPYVYAFLLAAIWTRAGLPTTKRWKLITGQVLVLKHEVTSPIWRSCFFAFRQCYVAFWASRQC